jgi:hypothetical protein
MKKLLLCVGMFFLLCSPGWACSGSSPNWTASSWQDIGVCAGRAASGDTITLPMGTYLANNNIHITKALTIQGAGCATTTYTSGIAGGHLNIVAPKSTTATDCLTVVKLAASLNLMWTCEAGKLHRLTGLGFIDNNASVGGADAPIYFDCSNQVKGGHLTHVRVDNNSFNFGVNSNALKLIEFDSVVGVMDHNFVENDANALFHIRSGNWYGTNGEPPNLTVQSGGTGNESRYYPVEYPGAEFYEAIVFEQNIFQQTTVGAGSSKGCTDGGWGNRFVVRMNIIYSCAVKTHGLDSDGWARAAANIENYGNEFVMAGFGYNSLAEIRDGQFRFTFLNLAKDIPDGTDRAAGYVANYRTVTPTPWFGAMDGVGPNFDVNDAGNPQKAGGEACNHGGSGKECQVASFSNGVVTVSGASFSTSGNGMVGSILKKTGCTEPPDSSFACHAPVIANTTTTLTIDGAPDGVTPVSLKNGDLFSLNLVTRSMDMPGVSDQQLLLGYRATNYGGTTGVVDIGGNSAKIYFDKCVADAGLGIGDHMSLASGNKSFDGIWPITATSNTNASCAAGTHDTRTFKYVGGGKQTNGSAYRLPSLITEFQKTDPIYQFLNTNVNSGACAKPCNMKFVISNASPRTTVGNAANANYMDYNGSVQTSRSSPFSGSDFTQGGVAVGTLANKPTHCQVGMGFWGLDSTEGGAWNSSSWKYTVNGADYTQGAFYKCTSTDHWDLAFTPYAFPHPLQGSAPNTKNAPR